MNELPQYFDPEADVSKDEQQRRVHCVSKTTYASVELARAAAVLAAWSSGERADRLSQYRCRFCNNWHLSSRD